MPITSSLRVGSLLLVGALAGGTIVTSAAHAQTAPAGAMRVAPSGRATTEIALTFADTAAARAAGKASVVRIDYGQPHLRGRTLHTDALVPYDKAWRLGANDPTALVTDVDLVIGGQAVPKGRYVLQAMPTRAGWTLLVQRPVTGGMADAMSYKPENDVARVPLRVTTSPASLESLTMWLIPSRDGAPKGELRLGWGTTMLAADWSLAPSSSQPTSR